MVPVVAVLSTGLAGCGAGGPAGGKAEKAPVVRVEPVGVRRFVTAVEAVGTAYAREQVVISTNVTERVGTLRVADGARVRKGDVLVELSRAEETADMAQARARLREADLQLERIRSLAGQGFASRARLDEQRAQRDALRAEVDSLEARIADRVIRAPFSGILGLRRVSQGMVAEAGTPILELSDISVIKLDFTVPETALAAIHVGQTLHARAAAFGDTVFDGRIESIDPQIDPVTRAAQVRALIPNADGRLLPGMLLTVDVVRSQKTAPAVPERAVLALRDESSVYVYRPQSRTVARQTITLGERQPGYIEVAGGLAPGTPVVVDGVNNIEDGQSVRLADKSAPAAAAGGPR